MKKIFIVFILLFSFEIVKASEVVDIVPIVNKCSLLNDNRIVIPVRVVVTNDGIISDLIDGYTLGYIDNDKDNLKVKVSDVVGDFEVYVDYSRDSEGRSLVYYSPLDNINVKKNDGIISFNIEVEFLDEVPSSYYLFGNEIVLSEDKEVCTNINGYEIKEVEKKVYVDLSKVDHTEMIEDLITKVAIGILLLVVVVLSVLLWRKKK